MADSSNHRPVIAVFITPKDAQALQSQEPPYDYIKYAEAARVREVPLYCFSAKDIDLEQGSVTGWVMDQHKQWSYKDVPWPDFVYNMAKGKAGRKKKAKLIKADNRLRWLNEIRSHHKWETHCTLQKDFDWLLPDTVRGTKAEELRMMLERHQAVMVKPDNGTWGSGISKIWRAADSTCGLQSSRSDDRETGLTIEEAFTRAQEIARGRRLIIQQALELLRVGPSIADLRLMMGKNRLGQWELVQWFLRIGRAGAIVSNWHSGGGYMDVIPGLVQAGLTQDRASELFTQAHLAAIQVSSALERAYEGTMVEVGLDFAFDTEQRLWLLEANGWPNKGDVYHEADPISKVYTCVIDYALFLWEERGND